MRKTVLPIALIVFGLAWLAREMGWFRELHVVVAVAFIILGLAIPITEGINRSSVVSGPFLAYVGIVWLAHDRGYAPLQIIWPVSIIVLGVLLFVARLPAIPDARPTGARREQTRS